MQPYSAQAQLHLQRDPALAALFTGEDRPIVGEHAGRGSPPGERGEEGVDHLRAQGDPTRLGGDVDPGVVIEDVEDLHLRIMASRQWVMSACQRWLGWSAQNDFHDDRGRFCGCGTTNPRRDKIRQIVEAAGTGSTPAI